MNYRNATFRQDGRIDCEIEHPQYGWIPFTADPADPAAGIDVAALVERITQAGDAAPYIPPPPAEIAALALRAALDRYTQAVQAHLDAAAQAAGYDTIYTAVSYAGEPAVPKFQAEGQAFRAWRSLVWAAANAVRADVEAGIRPVPTAAELIAELPALTLPTT